MLATLGAPLMSFDSAESATTLTVRPTRNCCAASLACGFRGVRELRHQSQRRRIGLPPRAAGFDRAIRQRLDWAADAERCIIGVRKRSRPFREVPTYGPQ